MVKLSSPRLDLKCDVSLKQIAVAGDILEICEEYYLNMLTIYGRFTVISHLHSKSTGDLIECLIENLSKLGNYGWRTKYLIFDSEGALAAHRRSVEERTGCRVIIKSHGSKVGVIELNNRCIREKVSTKYVTLSYECNSLIMKWLVIGAGNVLNCSQRKMYDDEDHVTPTLKILDRSEVDANCHYAYSPTDVVELYDDKVEPARTITVTPLTTAAGSDSDYVFYDPYNHETIIRHVESARVAPTPSDILEILKQNAQLHPVLPDKVAKIKGTIFDESYPQRSDSTHRGVANRGVRRQTVAADNNDMNENVPVNEVEEVDDEESPAENEEEVNSYDLRSRQTRGEIFLNYNPSADDRMSNSSALVSIRDDGAELRANLDPQVAPISNDFVFVAQTPEVMIDDINTIEQGQVCFSHAGLYVEGGGFVDYDTIKDSCVFTTNMQPMAAIRHYGKEATTASLVEEIDGLLKRKVFTGALRSSLSTT